MANKADLKERRKAPLATPSDIRPGAVKNISGALNALVADVFALYLKTKNFHWHMSGPHFRDYHLLLDEHGDQLFAMTDPIAERVRKIGGTTIRSIGHISRLQRIGRQRRRFRGSRRYARRAAARTTRELVVSMLAAHGLCDDAERRGNRQPARKLD